MGSPETALFRPSSSGSGVACAEYGKYPRWSLRDLHGFAVTALRASHNVPTSAQPLAFLELIEKLLVSAVAPPRFDIQKPLDSSTFRQGFGI
jgi:hypothetical protein